MDIRLRTLGLLLVLVSAGAFATASCGPPTPPVSPPDGDEEGFDVGESEDVDESQDDQEDDSDTDDGDSDDQDGSTGGDDEQNGDDGDDDDGQDDDGQDNGDGDGDDDSEVGDDTDGTACVSVSSDELDFGIVSVDQPSFLPVVVTNCSSSDELAVDQIEVVDSDGGTFSVADEALPGGLPDQPYFLPPNQSVAVGIQYLPTTGETHEGSLQIGSDDPDNNTVEVDLVGEGEIVGDDCPVAQAAGSVGDDTPASVLTVNNQDQVELTSEGSYASIGGDLSYEWAIIDRPSGSTTSLEPDATDPNPVLEVDIVGQYAIELIVYDEDGTPACAPAVINIFATPPGDIHLQLVWEAEQVEDLGGADSVSGVGTDLDIHYIRDGGTWGDSDSVYWEYPEQNWDDDGVVTLDIDDLYGENPENINHLNPQLGSSYQLGVHYYCDNNYGPTDATVRVFFGDALEGEYHRQLDGNGDFWHVGDVVWDIPPKFDIVDEDSDDVEAYLPNCEEL